MTKCSLFLNCFSVDVFVHVYELFVFLFFYTWVWFCDEWMRMVISNEYFLLSNDLCCAAETTICFLSKCMCRRELNSMSIGNGFDMKHTRDISQYFFYVDSKIEKNKLRESHREVPAFSMGNCVRPFKRYYLSNLFAYSRRKIFHPDALKRNINNSNSA